MTVVESGNKKGDAPVSLFFSKRQLVPWSRMSETYQPLEHYLLIGDLHSAALVSNNGSIDWLCIPHFDSPSVFAKLLDSKKGGSLDVHHQGYETTSGYEPDTAIVRTTFESDEHAFRVHDYMVPQETAEHPPHFLVRKFTGVSGNKTVTVTCDARAHYAKQCLHMHKQDNVLCAQIKDTNIWLHLPKDATVQQAKDCGVEISFPLAAKQTQMLILEYSSHEHSQVDTMPSTQDVTDYWKRWVAKGKFFDFCRDTLARSAITLKLMQYYPTGALIAAPTMALPEDIGGERNWDYRYTWIRDATFTLYALSVLGYKEEARRFFDFIEHIAEESVENEDEACDIDILLFYTILGHQPQPEQHLTHLEGYKKSQPVRLGNDAATQFQLDIYGSLIDAYYFMHRHDLEVTAAGKRVIRDLVKKIEHRWQEKEHGIWEVRSDTQHYTYGKVMAWVGVDRAVRMAEDVGFSATRIKELKKLREEIKSWIWQHCYDETTGSFFQHPDTQTQDASTLLFVPLQFLDRHDKRSEQIIAKAWEELNINDMFVYRYRNPDGLTGHEGAFVLCTQWLIASLAATGAHSEARELFEKLEKTLNHAGLFPEELDPETGAFLGNFPQAFSHMGYILSAYYLHRYASQD